LATADKLHMRPARFLLALLAILLVGTSTNASPAAVKTPTGLHAFLLRADEPAPNPRAFARTPAFAWDPVPEAVGYEFQLSTSDTFRENGVIYEDLNLKSPVASVVLTLPWINGSPHSLFARVRAKFRDSVSPWSQSYGFDMRQTILPKPLRSYNGLLRWTPVEGAAGYEVWLYDLGKSVVVFTNVLDEREFYTFHSSPAWTSKVHWRIRALRADVSDLSAGGRKNGLPAVSYGPWSPVYESTNTPNPLVDSDEIKLIGTVSDVISFGQTKVDPAHRLMPGFIFTGRKAADGSEAELFRVYVYTDSDCLNRVFTGAVVGGSAYAPRPYGPLSLPRSSGALETMRGQYVSDGGQGTTYAADGELVTPNESLAPPTPTTKLPGSNVDTPTPTTPPATDSGSDSGSGSGSGSVPADTSTDSSSNPGDAGNVLKVDGNLGAPVDLWDTDWPQGGHYWWTVVPVKAIAPAAHSTTTAQAADIGATTVTVASAAGFASGDVVVIGNASNSETLTVTGVNGNTVTFATATKQGHGTGEPVVRSSGNLIYRDLELPQEVCASGRVKKLGKSSEATLVSGGLPFASGHSTKGRPRIVTAVSRTTAFYGPPLIAWTPALAADAYHVQWSKTIEPFRPLTGGLLTFGTSAVLPLTPGTWYYRVRGISFHLPTNAQWMGWSDPARVALARPTYRVGGR
jgi:hypothetical protein